MTDVVTGGLALLIGLALCFRGYVAMRILLAMWGALFGFGVGAGLVAAATGDGVLSTVLAWAAGLGLAVLLAAVAYLYYEVSVLITMGAAGFVLGTTLLVALGVEWTWLVTLGGLVVGIGFGVLAIVADLPTILLTVLTALAGAATATAGLMLLTGALDAADLDEQAVIDHFETNAGWWIVYVALAITGVVVQARWLDSLRRPIRQEWAASGGRRFRDTSRA